MNADDIFAQFVEDESRVGGGDQQPPSQLEDGIKKSTAAESTVTSTVGPKTYEHMSQFFNAQQRQQTKSQAPNSSSGNKNKSKDHSVSMPLPALFDDLSPEEQSSYNLLLDKYIADSRDAAGHGDVSNTKATGADLAASFPPRSSARHQTQQTGRVVRKTQSPPQPGEWFTQNVANPVVAYLAYAFDALQPKAKEAGAVAAALGREFYTSVLLEWYKNLTVSASSWLLSLHNYKDFGNTQNRITAPPPDREVVLSKLPLASNGSSEFGSSPLEGRSGGPATAAEPTPLSESEKRQAEAAVSFITSVSNWVQTFFTIRSKDIDAETVLVSLPNTSNAEEKNADPTSEDCVPPPALDSQPSATEVIDRHGAEPQDSKRDDAPHSPQAEKLSPQQQPQQQQHPPSAPNSIPSPEETAGIFVRVEDVALIKSASADGTSGGGLDAGDSLPPMAKTTQGWGTGACAGGGSAETNAVDALLHNFMGNEDTEEEEQNFPTLRPTGRSLVDNNRSGATGVGGVGRTGPAVDHSNIEPVDALIQRFMEQEELEKATPEENKTK